TDTVAAEEATRFLIQLANLRGGPDNITAIVIRVGGQDGVKHPRTSTWDVLRKMHWSLPVLGAGVLLTGIAIVVAVLGPRVLGLLLFLFAALTICTGLVGLLLHAGAERRRRENDPPANELHVYREAPCDVDKPVVEKLARGIKDLRQKVEDSFPKLVPEACGAHYGRGEE